MRHGKKFNHLGRKKGHREALLMNLAQSLIEHKRINTTLAKAKACLLYTSDAADERSSVDLGGRRIIKQKKHKKKNRKKKIRAPLP